MALQRLIVPLFIPHQGCPYRCVFCDQNSISGYSKSADDKIISRTFDVFFKRCSTNDLPLEREAAFYGGSFTGLPLVRQHYLLKKIQPWIKEGWVKSIRVSTHPLSIVFCIRFITKLSC